MLDKQLAAGGRRYIEIVNWKKAQPRMKGEHNDWLKLYTSLLDNDAFAGLDDASRVLIFSLWLYAAASGRSVLPADPEWIWRKIPMLNGRPNLQPLLEATDAYGHPKPFVRYCEPKAKKQSRSAQTEKSRLDKRREDKSGTLTGSGRTETEKKRRVSAPTAPKAPKSQNPDQSESHKKEPQIQTEQAQKPANPMESEAGEAATHIVPVPPRSVKKAGPQHIGHIIQDRFPEHWQDADAEAFGWEIVAALGMPSDRQNLQIRSEWGAFAAWWCRVKGTSPLLIHGELRAMAIKKADYVRAKAKSARNKSKVWFAIMTKEMESKGIHLPPSRASPGISRA